MPKPSLRVVCLAASKGGAGKSTLSAALAVRAAEDGAKVCLIDADPQSSLGQWWQLRGRSDNPKLVPVDASPEGIELLLAEGYEWAFMDTPPALLNIIRDAIASADLVLIPSRTSAFDVLAVSEVVELCKDEGKPFAFVLNAVMASWGKIADNAEEYLRNHGPVCATRVAHRKSYTSASTIGKAGHEIDRTGAARREIDELWLEVKSLVSKAMRAKAKAHG